MKPARPLQITTRDTLDCRRSNLTLTMIGATI